MQRIIRCERAICHRPFQVVSPGLLSDYAHLPSELQYFECPYCKARGHILWPRGMRLKVVPLTFATSPLHRIRGRVKHYTDLCMQRFAPSR